MPENGIEVIATGQVRVYAARGSYQLYCESVEPVGRGAFELQFRRTLSRLQAEGLLEADRKKTLPQFPLRIAIVTSRATAALRDILKVFARHRYLRLYLYDVPVQGEGAAARLTQALGDLARGGQRLGIELILLARGGGSLEDLWSFNEEIAVRAVAESAIPLIAAVGHETDWTLIDRRHGCRLSRPHAHRSGPGDRHTVAHRGGRDRYPRHSAATRPEAIGRIGAAAARFPGT